MGHEQIHLIGGDAALRSASSHASAMARTAALKTSRPAIFM